MVADNPKYPPPPREAHPTFRKGRTAALSGASIDDKPYGVAGLAHDLWHDGFLSVKQPDKGGPREHIIKKALRGVDKGHTEQELIDELRGCLNRWEEMLNEHAQA